MKQLLFLNKIHNVFFGEICLGLNDGTFKWIGMEHQEVLSVEEGVKFQTVQKKKGNNSRLSLFLKPNYS